MILENGKSWTPFPKNHSRLPGIGDQALPLGRVEGGFTIILSSPLNIIDKVLDIPVLSLCY